MARVFEKFQRYFSSSSTVSNSSPRGHYLSDSDDEGQGRHTRNSEDEEEDGDLGEGIFSNPFKDKKAYRQVSTSDKSGDIFR